MATTAPPRPDSDSKTPYDANADQEYAPGSSGSLSAEERAKFAEAESSFYKPSATDPGIGDNKAGIGALLGGAESHPNQIGAGFKPDNKKPGFMAKFQGNPKLKKKVLILGGIGGGIGSIIILILLFVVLLSFLKIPGLKQNIINYQFARVSRQFADATTRNTETALAVDAATEGGAGATKEDPGGVFGGVKKRWQNLQDKMWSKFDNTLPGDATSETLIPTKAIGVLQKQNGLSFKITTSKITGREIIQSMTLNGETYEMNQVTGLAKWTPLLKNFVSVKNRIAFARTVVPALDGAMGANGVNTVIRGAVMKNLNSIDGIFFTAWALNQFQGKDAQQARVVEERTKYNKISQEAAKVPDNAATETISEAEDAASSTEQANVADDKKIIGIIDNNGVDQEAIDESTAKLDGSVINKVVGVADPFLQFSIVGCTILDASVQHSGPTIDNQVNQQRAAFEYIASAADQQTTGSLKAATAPELARAVAATNDDLGDTNSSLAYSAGYHGGAVNTSGQFSAEAGAGGDYTYNVLDALGVTSNAVGGFVNAALGKICPAMTSTKTAAALAGLNISISLGSFGVSDLGVESLAQGATAFAKAYTKHVITKVFGDVTTKDGVKVISKSFVARAKPYIAKQSVVLAGTAGLAEYAHLITAQRAGELQGGLNQGTDLANEAWAGGGIVKNDIERSQLFGRPMLMDEVCQSNQEDGLYMSTQTSSQSTYDRYFSPDYADSLLSRSAVTVDASLGNFPNNLPTGFGSLLLQPFRSVNSLLAVFTGKSGAAPDCNASSSNNGDVQFGYSQAEENLVRTGNPNSNGDGDETSFMPLQDQQVEDSNSLTSQLGTNNDREHQIAQKYAICFGYKYNPGGDGSLDPTDTNGNLVLDSAPGGSASIGTLLSNKDIVRDTSGNVVNGGGLCDPSNLGYDSPDPLANDVCFNNANACNGVSSPEKNDLIFRWRLAMENDTTIAISHNLQYVTTN